ncbi:hypothetical protein GGR50DRAFT_674403 [Xylaria sp. CBS 124048]|nr:hypothetical protein GGR50DRAFT_674403 [Xylaria sp. CBS 124048]
MKHVVSGSHILVPLALVLARLRVSKRERERDRERGLQISPRLDSFSSVSFPPSRNGEGGGEGRRRKGGKEDM